MDVARDSHNLLHALRFLRHPESVNVRNEITGYRLMELSGLKFHVAST